MLWHLKNCHITILLIIVIIIWNVTNMPAFVHLCSRNNFQGIPNVGIANKGGSANTTLMMLMDGAGMGIFFSPAN